MKKPSKTTSSSKACPKCGNTDPKIGVLGNVCANHKCSHVGTHIGACAKCGLTLLANTDPRCPRCMKAIVLAE